MADPLKMLGPPDPICTHCGQPGMASEQQEEAWAALRARVSTLESEKAAIDRICDSMERQCDSLKARVASWEKVFGHLGTPDEVGNEWIALKDRVAELEAALRYAGKHPEDCVSGEPGPCTSHMAYLEVEAERDGYVCPGCGRGYGVAGNKTEVPK